MCSEHRTSGAGGSSSSTRPAAGGGGAGTPLLLTHCGDVGEPWQPQLQSGHDAMPLL